jgi:hypothetical protein
MFQRAGRGLVDAEAGDRLQYHRAHAVEQDREDHVGQRECGDDAESVHAMPVDGIVWAGGAGRVRRALHDGTVQAPPSSGMPIHGLPDTRGVRQVDGAHAPRSGTSPAG